jgi:hypothetical protein
MAMGIGGTTDPTEVDMQAWVRLAEECELGRGIAPIVRRQTASVLQAVDHWRESAQRDGWHREVIDAIVEISRGRAAQLLES